MKVLVLGGTRYMGAALVLILEKNPSVSAVMTLSRTLIPDRDTNHIVCDRKNIRELHSAISKFKPDIIVDMINYAKDDSEGMVSAYEKGLLDPLKHYIVISSFFIYNHFNIEEYREKPIDVTRLTASIVDRYTQRKIEMESVLYDAPLMSLTSVLRLPFVFSSDDGRFKKICELSQTNARELLDDKFRFTMISKTFAAEGINYLINESPQGIVDYASSGCLTCSEIAKIIASCGNDATKDSGLNVLDCPYTVATNICTQTTKIPLVEDVSEAIKREALIYFTGKFEG